MAELGQTSDPRELIPGDPGTLGTTADTLTRFGQALIQAGTGLGRLDDGGWRGSAADAFHGFFDSEPGRWKTSGDAFHAASDAVRRHAATLQWAQGEGQRAISLWDQGQQATAKVQQAHQQQVAQAEQQAAAGGPAPTVPAFADPGEELRQQAQDALSHARTQLLSTGDDAARIVEAAEEDAPQQSLLGWAKQAAENLAGGALRGAADLVDAAGFDVGHFVGQMDRYVGGVGDVIKGVGDATGLGWLSSAGQTISQSATDGGDTDEDAINNAVAFVRNEAYNAAHGVDGQSPPVPIYIDSSEYPETAQHIDEAQSGTSWRGDQPYRKTQPSELTIDREGNAEQRSREAMRGIPSQPGKDRDEYPPKLYEEGGPGASVKYIDPSDNRGAGSTMGHQADGLPDGSKVVLQTVP